MLNKSCMQNTVDLIDPVNLSPFILLSTRLKGSTVNMNIMGWVYNKVADLVGSSGHTTLGASLMIGKCYTLLL